MGKNFCAPMPMGPSNPSMGGPFKLNEPRYSWDIDIEKPHLNGVKLHNECHLLEFKRSIKNSSTYKGYSQILPQFRTCSFGGFSEFSGP